MAKITDLEAKQTEMEATITRATTIADGAIALANGQAAIIGSLRQELADAIANGGNAAALDSLLARMTAAESTAEGSADRLAAALSANVTP